MSIMLLFYNTQTCYVRVVYIVITCFRIFRSSKRKDEQYSSNLYVIFLNINCQHIDCFLFVSAYQTVSRPAILVIAEVSSIKPQWEDSNVTYQRQSEVGKVTGKFEGHTRTYHNGSVKEIRGFWAKLTYKYPQWLKWWHGELDYHLTRMFLDHRWARLFH